MDELFECLVFIFGFLYIFKWMLDFLVKKFHHRRKSAGCPCVIFCQV